MIGLSTGMDVALWAKYTRPSIGLTQVATIPGKR